jgi:hypothetical protein
MLVVCVIRQWNPGDRAAFMSPSLCQSTGAARVRNGIKADKWNRLTLQILLRSGEVMTVVRLNGKKETS